MIVKGNQENLRFAIAERLREASSTETSVFHRQGKSHGRIELRTLTVLPLSNEEALDWPGAAQIGSIRRVRIDPRTGEVLTRETVYFVTSLKPAQATAEDLLRFARGHWTIENRVHYVRDVTFGEDASRLRKGSSSQVMAAFRNLVITILRRMGATNIATALVRNAAYPLRPLFYLLM